MKRRTLLVLGTTAAAGGLVIGWSVIPPRQRLQPATPVPVRPGQSALNGWVKIGTDDTVTILMAKSEMGQGVHTGLAALLAEELDADWKQLRIEHAHIDPIYNNLATAVDGLPFHPDDDGALKRGLHWMTGKTMREIGVMVTGGSSSIKDLWLPMREAGAAARAMLIAAAAAKWQKPAAECIAQEGRVKHASGLSASFGELAVDAAGQPLPATLKLKSPGEFKLIGQPLKRLEAAAKANGTATFGLDVLPPGLLYASVMMCPTLGGRAVSFDASALQDDPAVKKTIGVVGYNGGTSGVAVIATTPYAAMRALTRLKIVWDHGPNAGLASDEMMKRLTQVLDSTDGHAYHSKGDVDAALAKAARTISAEYRAPFLAHAAMEPMNCTVQFKDGKATVWAPTQVPGLARKAAAAALGIAADQVDLQVTLLGGGFGRRLDVDFIGQAAAIAREADGAPVQTFWSREQDTTHDFYRPACVARFKAGLDASGQLVAWHNVSAGPAIVPKILKRAFGLPEIALDKTTSEGAFDQPYEWPHARIAHEIVDLAVPVGFWRSVGHSHQAFFKESFVDEVAAATKRDPVEFRAALLAKHPRHLRVLQRAAELSKWGEPLAPLADGTKLARGIALHQSFGSIVAQVAEVSVKRSGQEQQLRVHRVVCVIDCGRAINPNLIRQQLESAIVFGLSAALYGEITIAKGQVQQSNFHDQPVLRIDACPVIETDIIASEAPPEGVGEPGTPAIAPAVANALFALTGQRLRSLPLKLT